MIEELKIIISAEIDKLKQALEQGQKELKDTEQQAKKSGANIGKAMAAAGKAVAAGLKVAIAGVAALGASMLAVAESTREFRTQQMALMTSFESAGMSAETAKNVYGELFGILGDAGQAQEAALHLGMLTQSEEELAQWTDVCAGVFTKFGESLPIEGLTEDINHTLKLGEAQGVLVDAIEKGGGSLQEFNDGLAACTSESEAQAYILEYMNQLYGEQGKLYKENAKDIIDANKAQLALTESTAALGAAIEPVITLFKVGLANALQGIIPSFTELSGGLQDVINGVEGGQERMSAAIEGIIDSILTTITNALPMILDVGLDIIVALLKGITNALPDVMQTLSDALPEIVKVIGELIPMITQAILSALPLLLQTIVDVVVQVINTLGEILPEIVSQIIEIVPQLVDKLVENIPVLLEAAINFLMAIVDAIPVIVVAILEDLPSIIDAILNSLLENIPTILDGAMQLLYGIIDAIPIIIPALVEALPQIISSIVSFLIEAIPELLDGAVEFLFALVDAIPLIIPQLIVALGQILVEIRVNLVEKIPALFEGIWKIITDIFENTGEHFKNWFGNAATGIKTAFSGIGTFFDGIWTKIKNSFGKVGSWFKDTFSAAWQKVKDVFSSGGKVFDGIKDGILDGLKSVVNTLIKGINKVIKIPFDGINGALQKLKDISILGVEPFGWISTINVPQIPLLEKGGVLEKGQIGLLEGNGAEAVVPLEKNTKWLDKLADMLKTKLSEEGGIVGGNQGPIILEVDGKTFAKTAIKSINQLTQQTGRLDLHLI